MHIYTVAHLSAVHGVDRLHGSLGAQHGKSPACRCGEGQGCSSTSTIGDSQCDVVHPRYPKRGLFAVVLDGMVILPEPDAGEGATGCTVESCTSASCRHVEDAEPDTCTPWLLPFSCLGVAPAEQHAAGHSKVIRGRQQIYREAQQSM